MSTAVTEAPIASALQQADGDNGGPSAKVAPDGKSSMGGRYGWREISL